MALSLQAELELVDAAITRALESQRFKTGAGQQEQENPDLATLFKRKDRLTDLIADAAGGDSMSSLAEFGRPI